MNDEDRAVARSCLAQVEVGLAELRGLESWWRFLSSEKRRQLEEFAADVRAYQHDLQK